MGATKTVGGRTLPLVLAAVRAVLGVVAIPLAPALYKHHFVVLVLLRPTKEVLLAGGFLFRDGRVGIVEMLLASLPLALTGVWLFYWLGRAFSDEIRSGEGLPKWATKVLPPERIQALARILERKGWGVVVAGRLAAFPSTLMAAAAGMSDMPARTFISADALGGVLSIALAIGAGYLFGSAYKRAGPWLTGIGVVVLVALLIVVGRWLKREGGGGGKGGKGAKKRRRSDRG
jgi:membrane protein DedA with SNARE-associated domain